MGDMGLFFNFQLQAHLTAWLAKQLNVLIARLKLHSLHKSFNMLFRLTGADHQHIVSIDHNVVAQPLQDSNFADWEFYDAVVGIESECIGAKGVATLVFG